MEDITFSGKSLRKYSLYVAFKDGDDEKGGGIIRISCWRDVFPVGLSEGNILKILVALRIRLWSHLGVNYSRKLLIFNNRFYVKDLC